MTSHRKEKKIKHFSELLAKKKNFIFQQTVLKNVEKFDYFRRNNCLFTKPNCKILHVSATNREKHAILAGFRKHNCILTRPI